MKFTKFSKILSKNSLKLFVLFSLSISFIYCDVKKESQNKKAECSISSIHIPLGSTSPVMVYNAKNEQKSWRITVLDREQFNEFNVEGDLFYTDKKTEESWFISESIDEKSFESLKDAFSLCKQLNTENKNNKDKIASGKDYEELRTAKLPNFIAKRTNLNRKADNNEVDENRKVKNNHEDKKNNSTINEEEKHNVKSFLQIQTFNLLSNSGFNEFEETLERLESDNFRPSETDSFNETEKAQESYQHFLTNEKKDDNYKKTFFIN